MTAILAQVHYLPDNWRGNAHTTRVRNEMSQLFQYKAVSLLAKLVSLDFVVAQLEPCDASLVHPH